MQKSDSMLKVASILLIVFGIIAAVVLLFGLFISSLLLIGFLFLFATIFSIAAVALNIYAGFAGLGACKDYSKANKCVTIGIVLLAVQAVSLLLNIFSSSFTLTNLIGLALPVVYYLGAKQLAN